MYLISKTIKIETNQFMNMTINTQKQLELTSTLKDQEYIGSLFWFLNKTKTGKSMRAYSDNEDLALLSGIDPKRVVMITLIIAGILATIGGALYGLDKSLI